MNTAKFNITLNSTEYNVTVNHHDGAYLAVVSENIMMWASEFTDFNEAMTACLAKVNEMDRIING